MSTPMFFILTAALLLFAPSVSAGTVTDPRRLGYSIYDGGICTSAIDCKPSQTCVENRSFGGVCRDNVAVGSPCGEAQCESNAFCDSSTPTSTCKPKLGPGAACDRNCRDGLLCKNGRCIALPNLPDGAPCGEVAYDDECRGFCKREFPGPFGAGVCVPASPPGAPCDISLECAQPARAGNNPVICNAARSEKGRCVRASQIIKTLGAPCNRANDGCDATRNLVCRWAPSLRKTVCLQRSVDEEAPCERGNPLSRCSRGLECRTGRQGVNPQGQFSAELVLPTLCLARVRRRSPGQPCLQERDRCTGSATCRSVPGVLRDSGTSRLSRTFTSPALYCTRTLKRFTQCLPQEKFLALCEDGFVCRAGKCGKSRKDEDVPITHAYDNAICESFPCGPGYECVKPKGTGNPSFGPYPFKRCREI